MAQSWHNKEIIVCPVNSYCDNRKQFINQIIYFLFVFAKHTFLITAFPNMETLNIISIT